MTEKTHHKQHHESQHEAHHEHHETIHHEHAHTAAHELKKGNKWMLPLSIILSFLFFVPLSALAGLIFGGISYKNSEKKAWPAVAIILNLVFGVFNFMFTQIFFEVFFLGR